MIKLWGSNKWMQLDWMTFPGGERNIKIIDTEEVSKAGSLSVVCEFKNSNDLIDMLLLVNAVKNIDRKIWLRLLIPYFPYARQDRVMVEGEALSLQIAVNLIKSCNFTEVETWDPHSDVLVGMFEPGFLKIKDQATLWAKEFYANKVDVTNAALVSPDAGALKKIFKLAKALNLPVIEASKKRDVATGNITSTTIDLSEVDKYETLYVVDDICDGGRTFAELAIVIRRYNKKTKLVLCVTHGIFSKGIEALTKYYDDVLYINDMRGE